MSLIIQELKHLRSLREDGIETILNQFKSCNHYDRSCNGRSCVFVAIDYKSIIKILKEHPQIDAVLPTMGGQTALNLCIEADEKGIWTDFGVDIIGVDIDAINITEDREKFRELMIKIGFLWRLKPRQPLFKRKRNCSRIWFPLVIRASLHLGGAWCSHCT